MQIPDAAGRGISVAAPDILSVPQTIIKAEAVRPPSRAQTEANRVRDSINFTARAAIPVDRCWLRPRALAAHPGSRAVGRKFPRYRHAHGWERGSVGAT